MSNCRETEPFRRKRSPVAGTCRRRELHGPPRVIAIVDIRFRRQVQSHFWRHYQLLIRSGSQAAPVFPRRLQLRGSSNRASPV